MPHLAPLLAAALCQSRTKLRILRKPPNCRMDSYFRITAPPTLVNQREAPEIPTAEFNTQGRSHDRGKNLQINLRRKIIKDFIEEEGDFFTGNFSG